MSDNGQAKELVVVVDNPTVAPWGDRQEIAALGRRVQAMLPGGDKMTSAQAMALAQYAALTDANPFRGEIYGYENKGRFVITDGYKLLVRWAKNKAEYTDKYEKLTPAEQEAEGLPPDALAFRCWIMREDKKADLKFYIEAGASFKEAYELAATCALGVVTPEDKLTREGKAKAPPTGWTWPQVAKKRALKNALNLSHGMPSPQELSAMTWQANGKQTTAQDWADIPPDLPPAARERWAAMNAQAREGSQADAGLSMEEHLERLSQHVTLMRGEKENGID
jgi:hypothetical protein